MKPTRLLEITIFTGIFATGFAHCETPASQIEILNARIAENQKNSVHPVITRTPGTADVVSEDVPNESLFATSAFLTDGRLTVIVPRGAVVSLDGQKRLSQGGRIVGKLVEWEEFLNANRAAIELIDIPGNKLYDPEPLEPEALEKIHKNKLVAVTTYQGKPVALKFPAKPSTEPSKP